MNQLISNQAEAAPHDTQLINLMRLAFEVGKAKKSGDQELIKEAKFKHSTYMQTCLGTINANIIKSTPVKAAKRMRH